jgi:hypothetical protein
VLVNGVKIETLSPTSPNSPKPMMSLTYSKMETTEKKLGKITSMKPKLINMKEQ